MYIKWYRSLLAWRMLEGCDVVSKCWWHLISWWALSQAGTYLTQLNNISGRQQLGSLLFQPGPALCLIFQTWPVFMPARGHWDVIAGLWNISNLHSFFLQTNIIYWRCSCRFYTQKLCNIKRRVLPVYIKPSHSMGTIGGRVREEKTEN